VRTLTIVSGLFIAMSLSSVSVLAAGEDTADFEKRKTEALSHIDQMIQKLQETRTCLSAATDREGMKKCRGGMREWHKSERMHRLEERKDRLEERIQKVEGNK
jgi:biopolymer transport protein ExbB/TolQ